MRVLWYLLPTGLALGYVLILLWSGRYHRRLKAAKCGRTLETFLAEFERSPYSRKAIEAAYLDIVELSGYPAARFEKIESLGIVPDDFEDVFNKRLLGLGLKDIHATRYARLLPIGTVDDYVRFLDEVMMGKPQGSS